ncbi:MAG TPA: protein kinase [Vicinamibacterales bacterium]|nr:protein kinase [Vicinamibacterales bacterium]
MRLAPGNSVGPYKILGPLGSGGMGEVYRAEHVRLGREVAVKVLPLLGEDDPVRRERFEREARILGSLNHPNIATLHGVEDCREGTLLEMELVPGETLDDRIKRGVIPPVQALPIFKQIAQALEAAHDRGIIHRDLKPSNVKITPEGQVKVLDFGLAKPFDHTETDQAQSPMFTTTTQSVILGTAAYMSPEQVRGKALDRRTDVWAFGCMLYEALTGHSPFVAETMSDTLAAVLRSEPDWTALPPLPVALQRLIRRCLQKDPQERLRDIADARLEIEEALGETAALRAPVVVDPPRWRIDGRWRWALVAAAGVIVAAAGAFWGGGLFTSRTAPIARLAVPVAPGQQIDRTGPPPLAVSPDGGQIVYVASAGGHARLYLRPLDRFEATPIASTDGATAPFFSPDGRWVGFYAAGALQKVSLGGGGALRICEAPSVWSASWNRDDTIVYATAASPNGLWRVAAGGGTPERLTTPDAAHGELQHAYPQTLPNGDILFDIMTEHGWQLAVLAPDTKHWRAIGQPGAGAPAAYVPSGSLVYAAPGGLVAVPFDLQHETLGAPIPLLEPVSTGPSGTATFAVSASGTLVYLPRPDAPPSRALVTADRDGRVSDLSEERAAYTHPRFSRDGTRLAVAIQSTSGSDIWVFDLRRGTRTRLTNGGENIAPVWSPDGRSITFQTSHAGRAPLYRVPSDGSAPPVPALSPTPAASAMSRSLAGMLPGTAPVFPAEDPQLPMSWSQDGEHLAFDVRKPSGEHDIWVLGPDGQPASFLLTSFDEHSAAFSPDGAWLAYVSDESGRNEVYVQPFPGPGGKWAISSDGGTEPTWSPSGRELFYRQGDRMVAVAIQPGAEFQIGAPHVLFDAPYDTDEDSRDYDVSADGKSFVMVRGQASAPPDVFRVVLNWTQEVSTHR